MLILCFFVLPALGMEFWVSPNGNDRNPGTSAQPFKSVFQAQERIHNLRASATANNTEPIKIVLRTGMYPLTNTLCLQPEDSGTEAAPVTIAAAPGETPVFSAGVRISGWKLSRHAPGLPLPARGNVWVADAPKFHDHFMEFRQLWVNGVKATRAREPNAENLARLIAWDKTNQIATIPTSALAGIKSPGRMEIIIDQVWEIAGLRVKSVRIEGTNALLTFKPPESDIEFQHPWPPVIVKTNYHAPFFLANAIEFLDSPGEWYDDLEAGKIYYWPRRGEDLIHAKVYAPALETLVNIDGTPDKPVANIKFKGIAFAYTTWLRPSQLGHVPLQAGMCMLEAKRLSPKGTPYHPGLDNLAWIARPPGAVSVENANHISFENCTFEHLASAGLDIQSGTRDDLVEGCTFRDIGGNGVQLGKFSDTNVETHVPYNPSDERKICTNERIDNNFLTDCANEDWGGVGICVGYARGVKIEHNEISNCSYTGISVGWGWTKMTNALRDNFIHANHVHHVATRLGDTAGIYTQSAQSGTVISENCIHDIKMSPYVPDPLHWFYLYLDEGSSYITVQDNWCPEEKFLKNANGPGNIWKNNGPQVSQKVRAAAGLEPAFQELLHAADPLPK